MEQAAPHSAIDCMRRTGRLCCSTCTGGTGLVRPAHGRGGAQSEEVPLLIMESLRARRQSVPAVLLYQLPELLNGCEATSLAMLLKSYGIAADKMELAYQYLPRAEFYEEDGVVYGPAPDDAYAGDPAAQRYYCYAQPVCTAANLYLQQAGADTSRAGPDRHHPCRAETFVV